MTPQSKITWDDLTPESPDMGTLIQSEAGKFGLRSSSYGRTPQHNAAVGGAVHSRHLTNQALDLVGTPEQRQQATAHLKSLYGDQIHELLDEGDHLHVSWNPTGQVAPRTKMNWDDLTEESPTPMKAPSVASTASTASTTHAIAPIPGTKTIPIPKSAEGEHALVSMFNEARDRGNQGMMQSFAESLKSEYGYEAGPGEGGWWYVKPPSAKVRAPLPSRKPANISPSARQHLEGLTISGGATHGGNNLSSLAPATPEPRSEPTTLTLGPASIRSPGQNEGVASHVSAITDPIMRPIQYLSTAVSGVFRKSGADINSLFGGPDSPYTWKQVLDAANESFYTGKVRPGFEVPVKELTKLAMEQAGLDPEGRLKGETGQTWKDKAAKTALEVVGGIGDPVNIATAEGVAKPLLRAAGMEPIAAVPKLPAGGFPEETGPVPLLHRPLEEVYKPSGAADTLAGQRWAGEQARRAQTASENAPPVDESIRPGLRRAREVASEPLQPKGTPGTVKPVEPVPVAPPVEPSIPGGVERRIAANPKSSIPPVGVTERRGLGERVRGAVSDMISPENARNRRAAERAAETDDLTGLANQRAWNKAKAAAEADPNLTIVQSDLNNAKAKNDLHGHAAGDKTIQMQADAMRQAAREHGESRVFRNGIGDEVAAIVPNDKAEAIARRAEQIFEDEKLPNGQTVSLSAGHGQTLTEAEASLAVNKAAKKGVGGSYRAGEVAGAAKVEPVPGVKPSEPTPTATSPTPTPTPTERSPKFNPMTGEPLPPQTAKPVVEPVPGTTPKQIPGERSLPKTLEESGLEGGTDRQYDVQSHAQTQSFAEARLARGLDSAVEWVKSTDQPSAEHTATGILAIRDLESAGRLKEASDLAGHLSERLTRTGQAADAARIAQELSPERSLMIAQRIASNSGRKLTEDMSTRLVENTKIARTAETKINDINVKLKSTPLAARLESAANEARQRITAANEAWKARTSEHGAISLGGVQGNPVDYAIVGAQHITAKGTLARPEGLVSLESWSKAMKEEFPQIRDKDLPNLFKESYERVQAEKSAMRESGRVKGLEKDLGKQTVASLSPDQVKSLLKERELLRSEQAKARQEMASVFNRLEHGHPLPRAIIDVASIPRTAMTTGDISRTFRQGIFAWLTEPKVAMESFARQIESFGSKDGYEAGMEYLESHPRRRLAEQSGVDLLSLKQRRNPMDLANRDEYFPSKIVEKVPGYGNIVEASNRGFVMHGDIERMELFDKWYDEFADYKGGSLSHHLEFGKKPPAELTPHDLKQLGKFVNTVGGRTSLGKFEHAAPILNQFLFAPKLLASRLQLMNPIYFYRMPKGLRRLAAQKAGRFYGTLAATLYGISKIPGVSVESNPRDPDFAKIKIKNTRVDISGGQVTNLRMVARTLLDIKDIVTAPKTKTGEKQAKDAAEHLIMKVWGRYLRGKQSPNLSLGWDRLVGEDYEGHKFQLLGQGKKDATEYSHGEPAKNDPLHRIFKGEIPSRLWPMVISDAFEGFEEGGIGEGSAAAPLSALGFGVQTYKSDADQKRERAKSSANSTVAPVPTLPPPTP